MLVCPKCNVNICAPHVICHVDIILGEVNRGAPDYIAHAVCPACAALCHYRWLYEFPSYWRQEVTERNMLPMELKKRIERPIDRKQIEA